MTLTMRSWSGMKSANIRKSVVLPSPFTTNKQSLSAANLFPQEVRKWPCQRATSDQVIDRVAPAG